MEDSNHFLSEKEINGDNIVSQDDFNFNIYAEKVKKLIQLNSNNREPITIGIYGKWGEGKTSFSNLIKHKIEHFEGENKKEYLIYNFNPWRYSTEDEILFDFFDGLKKQFYVKDKDNLQIAGEYLLKYSKYLKAIKISATVGLPKILNSKIEFSPDKIFEALGEDLKGEEVTIKILRKKVNEEINKKNFKILIFIDDIDRLDDNEIYTLFKLVKLNANFDNFIFILNFDEEQVAKALMKRSGKELEDGKKYLEKIINIPIHLPKIESLYLERYFRNKLTIVLNQSDLVDEVKQDIVSKIDFYNYNFNNPRQIIRTINSFFIGSFTLFNEVNLIDLFSLEYLKIENPNIYNQLKKINYTKELDILSKMSLNKEKNDFRSMIDKILLENNDKLFLKTLLDKNRINDPKALMNPDFFNRYFSYHIGNNTPNQVIEELINSINGIDIKNIELEKLFQYDDAYIKLLQLINNFKSDIEKRNELYLIIIKNINSLNSKETDYYGLDDKQRIIERIATNLNENPKEDNSKIVIQIANALNVNDLCYFIRKFKEDKTYKIELINILVEKAQNEYNKNNPVYIESGMTAKMIMIYWNNLKPVEFKMHIEESLTDLERIKNLVRNFPIFILGRNTFGGLIEKDFKFMKENFLDVDFIFKKINEFDEKLIKSISLKDFPEIDEMGDYSEEDNLKQFVYWYLKMQNLDNKLNEILE